ncbi:MAG: hypothetical protein NT175_08675 [Bacteroidetes bacterium]|nr:hypothetical protein [Bacteroidota bacterium]
MTSYRIPDDVKKGFTILLKSPQKKIDSLISELAKIPKGLLPSEITEYISKKKVFSKDDPSYIVKVLLSLYTLKESETKPLSEIVINIQSALNEAEDITPKPNENFINNFIQLLSLKTIGLTCKAFSLLMEYEKTYVESRIITDIRPVFTDDLEENIDMGVIVHNLRIEYHKGQSTHEEIFIALDSDDLRELKERVIRAEKKEKAIRTYFAEKISFLDTSKE